MLSSLPSSSSSLSLAQGIQTFPNIFASHSNNTLPAHRKIPSEQNSTYKRRFHWKYFLLACLLNVSRSERPTKVHIMRDLSWLSRRSMLFESRYDLFCSLHNTMPKPLHGAHTTPKITLIYYITPTGLNLWIRSECHSVSVCVFVCVGYF